jgi:uncharacterized protein (TIGR01777 family)
VDRKVPFSRILSEDLPSAESFLYCELCMSRKRIALSGATGFIGTHINKELLRQGYEVWPLVRKEGYGIFYDYNRMIIDEKALSACDAVVHCAGKNIMGFWTKSFKREVRESRILSTKLIVDAMRRISKNNNQDRGPKILLCASAVGFYGDSKNRLVDESASVGEGFLAHLCEAWEHEAQKAQSFGVRVVNMRFASVLGLEGGILPFLQKIMNGGLLIVFGAGKNYMPLVGINDVVRALLFLLKEPSIKGAVNVVCPEVITQKEFISELSHLVRHKLWIHIPEWILKALGEQGVMLLYSCRPSPRVLSEAGFQFEQQTIREILQDIYKRN